MARVCGMPLQWLHFQSVGCFEKANDGSKCCGWGSPGTAIRLRHRHRALRALRARLSSELFGALAIDVPMSCLPGMRKSEYKASPNQFAGA